MNTFFWFSFFFQCCLLTPFYCSLVSGASWTYTGELIILCYPGNEAHVWNVSCETRQGFLVFFYFFILGLFHLFMSVHLHKKNLTVKQDIECFVLLLLLKLICIFKGSVHSTLGWCPWVSKASRIPLPSLEFLVLFCRICSVSNHTVGMGHRQYSLGQISYLESLRDGESPAMSNHKGLWWWALGLCQWNQLERLLRSFTIHWQVQLAFSWPAFNLLPSSWTYTGELILCYPSDEAHVWNTSRYLFFDACSNCVCPTWPLLNG